MATTPSDIHPEDLEIARLVTLASDFNSVGLYASKYEDTYVQAHQQISEMIEQFHNVFIQRILISMKCSHRVTMSSEPNEGEDHKKRKS